MPFAYAETVTITEKKSLSTLKAGDSDELDIKALSGDGKIAGGYSEDDSGNKERATLWLNNNDKVDLGTLKANNSGKSTVNALSADGKIAVGWSQDDTNVSGVNRVTVWHGDNWQEKTSLGNAYSYGRAVSSDGKVVGGSSHHRQFYTSRATIWSGDNWATETDLGTLKADNSGGSSVNALSADGKIAGGDSTNDIANSFLRAVIWSGDNWQTKTDLGTLKADDSGMSTVNALSADGKVAVGNSTNDHNEFYRAVVWSGNNWQTKTDLGTLKTDNTGGSTANAISADGKVVGGQSHNNDDIGRATIWSGDDWTTKTDLGTLRSDGGGSSSVRALSADGKVAGGWSQDDNDKAPATLWRLDYASATTPVVGKIDVANTISTINQLGQDSMALISMQAHALDRLQYTCHTDEGICFSLQEDISVSNDQTGDKHRDIGVGASIGYGFGNGLSVGVSLDHSLNRKLPTSYRHQGDDIGIGAMIRYQTNDGVFGEVSYTKDDYVATIIRPTLTNTELGVNDATIKGQSYGIKAGKSLTTKRTNVRTYVGVKHLDVSRDAYSENEHTAFPISYGQMNYQTTYITAGANAQIGITNKLAWVSNAEITQKVSGDDPTYTASLTGVEKHEFAYQAKITKTTGQFATGVRYQVTPKTHFELLPYVKKHNNGETGKGLVMRLEGKF